MFQKIPIGLLISFSRNMAGHSKWANIKHIKGAKDAERAALHLKLFRQMKVTTSFLCSYFQCKVFMQIL